MNITRSLVRNLTLFRLLFFFKYEIQLSNVDLGGKTAFPNAGVAVTPVKGGAAFWWNLKTSGRVDTMTLHGGCPVLLGSKWGNLNKSV